MLVHRCQPEAVHTSAELRIVSKDTAGSEEIAFLRSHGRAVDWGSSLG